MDDGIKLKKYIRGINNTKLVFRLYKNNKNYYLCENVGPLRNICKNIQNNNIIFDECIDINKKYLGDLKRSNIYYKNYFYIPTLKYRNNNR